MSRYQQKEKMMVRLMRRALIPALVSVLLLSACGGRGSTTTAGGGSGSDPGITDTSIKIAASFPFTGPAASYAVIPDAMKAYFQTVNAAGGINGRKIDFQTADDGYDATKTVQATRKFVEQDNVFAIAGLLGTGPNLAVMDYLNGKKVPQLFITTGADKFSNNLQKNPWTINFPPAYSIEGAVYGKYLVQTKPNAKVAILAQSDDLGADLTAAFEKSISGSGVKVVAKETYAATDASVASQAGKLAASGADTLALFTTPKAALQALTTAKQRRWNPLKILNTSSASIPAVLKPYGLADSKGIVAAAYYKDPSDPEFADDQGVKDYLAAMKQYAPKDAPVDSSALIGYNEATAIVAAIKGMKAPTRAALMDSARSLDVELPMLLPGIKVQTTPTDGRAIKALQIQTFDGSRFVRQGQPIVAE
jgi:branched-chain amino acid transport system substrate-binding protein